MKIMRFIYQEEAEYGVVTQDSLRKIEGWPSGSYAISEELIPIREVKVLPPVMPSKVVAIGLNYAKHVTEVKLDRNAPSAPLFS